MSILLPAEAARQIFAELFAKLGFTGPPLEAMIEMSYRGWEQGVSTHGANVGFITHGMLGVDVGLVKPDAEPLRTGAPEIAREHWDGQGCVGPYAALKAADRAIEKLGAVYVEKDQSGPEMKAGMVAMRCTNTCHVVNPGALVEYLTSKGYSARLYTWGTCTECMQDGQEYPRSSTVTVTWGLPTKFLGARSHDTIADFSLAYAMGKVRQDRDEGRSLPANIDFFDMDGKSVKDPAEVFPNGGVNYETRKAWAFATLIELNGAFSGFNVPTIVAKAKEAAWLAAGKGEPKPNLRPGGFDLIVESMSDAEAFEQRNGVSLQEHVSGFMDNLYGAKTDLRIPYQRRDQRRELSRKHGGLLLNESQLAFLERETSFRRGEFTSVDV